MKKLKITRALNFALALCLMFCFVLALSIKLNAGAQLVAYAEGEPVVYNNTWIKGGENFYYSTKSVKFLSSAEGLEGYSDLGKTVDVGGLIDVYEKYDEVEETYDYAFVYENKITAPADMSNMFAEWIMLEEVDLSNLDTSNVTNMSSMFESCLYLTTVVFGDIDTTNVEDVSSMFSGCQTLETLDLSALDLSSVNVATGFAGMFSSCDVLSTVYAPKNLPVGTTIELPSAVFNYYADEVLTTEEVSEITDTTCSTSSTVAKYTTLSSAKEDVTFEFTGDPSKTYDGNPIIVPGHITNTDGTIQYLLKKQNADNTWGETFTEYPSNAGHYGVWLNIAEGTNHNVLVTDINGDPFAEFTISKQEVIAPTADASTFVYNGSAQTYTLAEDIRYTISGTLTKTNAGSNQITVSLNDTDNYCWVGGSSEPLTYDFVIAPKVVTVPVADTRTFTYNGQPHTYNLATSSDYSITGDTTRTNAGTEILTVSLPSETNYAWSDTTTGVKTFNFVIGQKEVGLSWSLVSENLVYSGQAKTLSATATGLIGSDECAVNVELSAGKNNVNVGAFTYTATGLNNDNYKLPSSNVESGEYTITKATNQFVTNFSASGCEYGQTPAITAPTSTFGTVNISYSTEENGEYQSEEFTNAGTYWVKASVIGTDDYSGLEEKLSFTISPKVVTVPVADTRTFTYNGQSHTYNLATSEDYSITGDTTRTNAGTETLTVSLLSETNYVWSDTTTGVKTFEFAINRKIVTIPVADTRTFTYNGQPHTYNLATSEDYSITGDTTRTNAGSQTLTVSLLSETNYVWSDTTTGTKTFNFVINKKVVVAPADAGSKTYTGETLKSDLTETADYRVVSNEGGVVAGSYEVKLQLKDKNNNMWSTGEPEFKTLNFTINKAKAQKENVTQVNVPTPIVPIVFAVNFCLVGAIAIIYLKKSKKIIKK